MTPQVLGELFAEARLAAWGPARVNLREGLSGQLVERHGVSAAIVHPLNKPVVTIGRAPGKDILLPYDGVSRNHAEVRWEDGRYLLYGTSKNGTYLNGQWLERRSDPQPLVSGDVITLANIPDLVLAFSATDETVTRH